MTEAVFHPGEQIENRYRVLAVAGSGAMGTLYRVVDTARDDQILALKTVRLDTSAAEIPATIQHFQREFRLLTQLRHPNLVTVHNFGVAAGNLYFTMEFIDGPDLDAYCLHLTPADSPPVIVQICRALAYLHARGIIHGDLKPSNVLIDGDQVRIVDFGVSIELRSARSRSYFYTPGYAAPEVVRLQPVDQRTDLYSLGAIWYTLFTGQPPLFMPDPAVERLIRLTLMEALEDSEERAGALVPVITRLLSPQPANRYPTANAVILTINETVGGAFVLETRETAGSYALRGRFVGREQEMGVLQAAWERVQMDAGRVVLVSGSSGVGKTRLVEEFVVQAELGGARVAVGRCVEAGGHPYQPWREILRVLVRYVEAADRLTLRRAGPVLAMLLPELHDHPQVADAPPMPELEPRVAQQWLNDAIADLLRAAARLRPTVLVVEDTHWADEASLELLHFLSRVPLPPGLLIGVTYRQEDGPQARFLDHLSGQRVEHVRLHVLSGESVTELVCSMLGIAELPDLLARRLQETTEGNAFFVQELVRALAEEGMVLQRTVSGWQVDQAALQKAKLPSSIREVVEERLSQLPEEARRVLEWAAVVGTMFWKGAVARAGGLTPGEVRAGLSEGLERELIHQREQSVFEGEREYVFVEPAIQQVSYENVPGDERPAAHGRVAAWLVDRAGADEGEHLARIAVHLEAAGEVEQAVDYLQRAGEQAAAQFANAEAIDFFERALELLSDANPAQRYQMLRARERVYNLQGKREAQRHDLEGMEELADLLEDDELRTQVALRWSVYGVSVGDYPMAEAAVQKAVRLAHATGDVEQEAQGYLQWGRVIWRQGNYPLAQQRLERALELADALPYVKAGALRSLGIVLRHQGDYASARDYYERSQAICHQLDDRRGEGSSFNNLGVIANQMGDYGQARDYYKQGLRIFRETGNRRGEARGLGNLGIISSQLGDYIGARAYFEQALPIFREVGDVQGEGILLGSLAVLLHYLGENEEALAVGREALELAEEIGDRSGQGAAWDALGDALHELGRVAEAGEAYGKSLALRLELGEVDVTAETRAGLARVLLSRGEIAEALAQVEEVLRFMEHHSLDGTADPMRIYFTCYRVLHAAGDPRADELLTTAHELLQTKAARISDEGLRRSYLEQVTVHRHIRRAFAEREE